MTRRAAIRVGDRTLDVWTDYAIDSDLEQPADGWRLTAELGAGNSRSALRSRAELVELLAPGVRIEVLMTAGRGSARILTGILEEREVSVANDGGTSITVEGRDLAAHLVDSSVSLDVIHGDGERTFFDVASAAVEPWGIAVSVDPTLAREQLTAKNSQRAVEVLLERAAPALGYYGRALSPGDRFQTRAPLLFPDADLATPSDVAAFARAQRRYANALTPAEVRQIRAREGNPRPGETVWEYLDRHARRVKLRLWMTPDGRLLIGSPDYGQASSGRIVLRFENDPADPNNVLEGKLRSASADRYSEVTVYGRGFRERTGTAKVTGTATDPAYPGDYPRPLVVHDSSLRTDADCAQRARSTLAYARSESEILTVVVPGHESTDGSLYGPDTVLDVVFEPGDIAAPWYVFRRSFECDRDKGRTTRLHLHPLGAWNEA